MANINKIKLSGTTYNIQDLNASKTVELTQAQYDALVSGGTVDPNTFYVITDAQGGDLSNYYTKSETSGASQISTALNAKQDTLVSGTNIKTINNESILGSGNINIKGGGVNVVQTTGTSTTDVMSQNAVTTQLSGYVTTDTLQTISGRKVFTFSSSSSKAIEFKQTDDTSKLGFTIKNSASTNNELASFEFRPNTFTVDGVQHPLLYFGHYRNTNTANAGVPQTVIGFRQYDQANSAAYNFLAPLPSGAKTPFNLTTTFKDFYMPIGIKVSNSTTVTASSGGVVDISSYIGGGGGGKAVTGGTNISVTTGETADTINCTLPIYINQYNGKGDINIGTENNANFDYYRIAIGRRINMSSTRGGSSIAIGVATSNSSEINKCFGSKNVAIGRKFQIGESDSSSGVRSDCVVVGNEAKSLINNGVAIGSQTTVSGTTKTNINNQLTIDTSNQVYIYNKDNTEMICLQDNLGGGGSSYTAGDGIDITNDVISVTGKVDASTYNTYTAATDTALASKADTATTYTKTETDNAITAATSTKQDTLVSGTNIKTINNESILGSGNIEIQGGGKAVAAGTNISITTGETADTINCTLPITVNTGNKNVTVGYNLNVREEGETSIGKFNINRYNKATTHSENTIFTVGNGGNNSLRHNALEIRKNGDLYFADTSNDGQSYYQKPMVRLQDMYGALGGFKLVKLTQSEYDALTTKDDNTLYVIVN